MAGRPLLGSPPPAATSRSNPLGGFRMNAPTPWPIVDTPNTHGMFMLGTTTLYLCHMPMFCKEDHHYQMTLQVSLDAASMATYLADKAGNPGSAYNLINLDTCQFTLPDLATGAVTTYPAIIYRDYSNDGGGTPSNPIVQSATVTVERVLYYRAFDQNIPRPDNLSYILFGDGQQAHLDHYIAADPDFQHLLTLPEAPNWLSVTQLKAGVLVTFPPPSTPIGCSSPLAPGSYQVQFQGIATATVPLQVGDTFWYSTGNMLNMNDPCASQGAMAMGEPVAVA
ncbi:hypothetical protein EIB18_02985 [Caulobacter vibrioides]|nr:hypothetical protein CA608_02915 [Caulobacter vibrioides]AZH11779.1 hypothetical protein EIB18_02985 [Caulobacter vibrioides]PLR11852.1 hypothetical protein CVUC_10665 [Caulobacter vibrioides]